MTNGEQLGLFELSPQEMVEEFHRAFGCDIGERGWKATKFRMKLIEEEYEELWEELDAWKRRGDRADNLPSIIKEAADLLYVVYGLAVTFGFDLEEAFRRVHASNMSKLGLDGKPEMRDDGKVLKGPNYFEPDLSDLVKED
jgi:NTP pyrophosphatase (non-canonical NTP hydrolase)